MTKLTTIVACTALTAGTLSLWGMPAYADSTFRGTVVNLNPANRSFTFVSDHMGTFKVALGKNDPITDTDDSTRHFSDLANGEKIKVSGNFSSHDKMFESVSQVIIQHD